MSTFRSIFEFGNLVDSSLVTPTFEGFVQPKPDQIVNFVWRQGFSRKAEDIGVVMIAAETCGEGVVADCGPDTFDFIGRNRNAYAGSAS